MTIVEKDKEGKTVKKQLEVDFTCNKGSKKYYIQSAYMLGTEETCYLLSFLYNFLGA